MYMETYGVFPTCRVNIYVPKAKALAKAIAKAQHIFSLQNEGATTGRDSFAALLNQFLQLYKLSN